MEDIKDALRTPTFRTLPERVVAEYTIREKVNGDFLTGGRLEPASPFI